MDPALGLESRRVSRTAGLPAIAQNRRMLYRTHGQERNAERLPV
jgi:hypothetical protein